MSDDRQAIMQLFSTWLDASKRRDMTTLRTLMAEDIVFLRAGHSPMIGADAFAKEFESAPSGFELNIRDWQQKEIHIEGSLAYCWTFLSLEILPGNASPGRRMEGQILSILRKLEDGRWVLSRDANMLMPTTS